MHIKDNSFMVVTYRISKFLRNTPKISKVYFIYYGPKLC